MLKSSTIIDQIIASLPAVISQHKPASALYKLFDTLTKGHIETLFSEKNTQKQDFGPFGPLAFPYRKMGAIDSLDLFGLDELILFSFYWANRHRYKKTLDIGANIGLHSLLMSRAGFEVNSYEPDSTHFQWLQENMALNGVTTVKIYNAAISNKEGKAEFVRVLGNTTSSHLAGAKNSYGDLEKYTVNVADIKKVLKEVDLIKMDVEGHEAEILLALDRSAYEKIDILVEIGSEANAESIYNHIKSIPGIQLFAQKKGWDLVEKQEDMPTRYLDGTLFISAKKSMPW